LEETKDIVPSLSESCSSLQDKVTKILIHGPCLCGL